MVEYVEGEGLERVDIQLFWSNSGILDLKINRIQNPTIRGCIEKLLMLKVGLVGSREGLATEVSV